MKTTLRTSLFALAIATFSFACGDNTKNDNVDGVVDSTAVSEPTLDEAMNTSEDTATVVRTDSTAMQEMENTAGDVKDGAENMTR